jgi:hypothetical protein
MLEMTQAKLVLFSCLTASPTNFNPSLTRCHIIRRTIPAAHMSQVNDRGNEGHFRFHERRQRTCNILFQILFYDARDNMFMKTVS